MVLYGYKIVYFVGAIRVCLIKKLRYGVTMRRTIEKYLIRWKNDQFRKVLMIRGARQVGKTHSVRELAKTFDSFVEVNFEIDKEVKLFFEHSIQPRDICEKLSVYYRIPIVPGKTLVFLDEIQACVPAIQALRFFHEKMPQLHVVAAGSLLEFVIAEIPSFGTGRIQSMFMYPMSFLEFVEAVDGAELASLLEKSGFYQPIHEVFHGRLLELLRKYLVLGGMPAVVSRYVHNGNMLACQEELDSLLHSINDDFRKYKSRIASAKIQETMESVARQTGGKFKYLNISVTGSHEGYRTALELLCMAGIVHKVYHTAAQGIPLGAQIKENRFKTFIFDTGLYQRILGLDIARLFANNNILLVHRGALAEQFVCLELLAGAQPTVKRGVYYWVRENPGSNAEVDFILQNDRHIIPVEVKSGGRGSMQSLHVFLAEHNVPYGIRLSQENYAVSKTFRTVPIYAAGLLVRPDFSLD